mgnify:CR=1 FL=1
MGDMCLLFCAAFAWLASLAGLAPIIGGFAAGLLLDRDGSPVESLRPLNAVLVPLFFVAMGMKADLRAVSGLTFGLLLVVAAILGKLACGLGVLDKNCNRWAVSAGMIARAEVALIFAGAGLQSQILDKSVFSAVVLVVIVTTLLAPLDYTRILYSSAIGYFLFGELPGLWSVAGMALIVFSSIYLVISEKRKK